jgi:hypothetical protein
MNAVGGSTKISPLVPFVDFLLFLSNVSARFCDPHKRKMGSTQSSRNLQMTKEIGMQRQ